MDSVSHTSKFRVDPRITEILGESYRSSEQALKELVDNAWDAEATRIVITLPQPMTQEPIVLVDNGSGMTPDEVQQEYLHVGRNRRMSRGERTKRFNRLVKGQKGIGKFAGLMVADLMQLRTTARNVVASFDLRRSDILGAGRDLEEIEIPVESIEAKKSESGTTITLSDLHQNLAFPNPDKLRALVIREYGREDGIEILINGEAIKVTDLPGKNFEKDIPFESGGKAKLKFTVADGKRNVRDAGIAVRVGGKIVGKPQDFGLREDELVPKNLLGKVYGEVELEGVDLNCVTADNGGFVENHRTYQELTARVAVEVRNGLEESRGAEMRAAKARYQKTIIRRLEKLPENRRAFATRALDKVLQKFFLEDEEKFGAIISVVLDALEIEPYWKIIEKLDNAKAGDVQGLAEALMEFGIADLTVVGRQAFSRNRVLDDFQRLVDAPSTKEADVHRVLESNLWILDIHGKLISSNETLKKVVDDYLNGKYKGDRASKRPDLLVAHDVYGHTTVVELKRPDHTINRDDENQAVKYRDDLQNQFQRISIVLIGKGKIATMNSINEREHIEILSYRELIARSRSRLTWLINELKTTAAS